MSEGNFNRKSLLSGATPCTERSSHDFFSKGRSQKKSKNPFQGFKSNILVITNLSSSDMEDAESEDDGSNSEIVSPTENESGLAKSAASPSPCKSFLMISSQDGNHC